MRLLVLATACLALAARADGLDRDNLLTEAPAVPPKGTVRISGVTTGTSADTGVDGRLQAEIEEEGKTAPTAPPKVGRDYDLTVGPSISWIVARNLSGIARNLQLQALVGMAQPKRTDSTSAVGILSASIDF